jgi:hypothetical protein
VPIQRDMVAVRVSRDHRLAVVGSPDYFASHAKPSSPHDLPNHRCINLHGGSAGPYRWEFEKNADAVVVDVSGPLVVDDADLMIRAAVDGLGLTFSFEVYVAPQIVSGALVRVLEDWCSPFAGYFFYYPSRGSSQLRYRPSSRRFGYNSINRTSEAHPCRKTVHRSRWSSIFLQRIIGSIFMRVNSKCAHQVRPPLERVGGSVGLVGLGRFGPLRARPAAPALRWVNGSARNLYR